MTHRLFNKYRYLVCGWIEFDCGRTYGRTYGRSDRWTFLLGLLGHLSGDDLKMANRMRTKIPSSSSNSIAHVTGTFIFLLILAKLTLKCIAFSAFMT